jgi:ribonucleoside-diphosphate reductase alpha chain
LNKVIDRNYYPVKEAENSNRHSGLGVQDMMFYHVAFAFYMMKLKAESRNFETLYFAAVTASMEMAKWKGLIQHSKGRQSLKENSSIFGM